uniref:hypothetical protein n=1 Tax=[Kitasatospora] papulosa TaxID=1464011 RepID=UPI0036D88CA7
MSIVRESRSNPETNLCSRHFDGLTWLNKMTTDFVIRIAAVERACDQVGGINLGMHNKAALTCIN